MVDDFEGMRRHDIPLDAIVIDSPWATQYNTWGFNPFQFPDAAGLIRALGGRLRFHKSELVNHAYELLARESQERRQPGHAVHR